MGFGVALSAAAACSSAESGRDPNGAVAGDAGATSEAGKADTTSEAGKGSHLGGGGAGGGGAGGDPRTEGGTGGHPDVACGVAKAGAGGDFGDAHLTRQLPDEPFVIERMPPDNWAYDESAYPADDLGPGPWTLSLEPDGAGIAGHVVLFDTSAVSSLQLEPEGDHYRFAASATLVNYTYAADVVPGICLDQQAKVRLLDDDGDCVADRLVLSGSVRSLGTRGGDYERDCGDEYFPVHLEARTLSQSERKPTLEATNDPLRPVLRAPAIYSQATATLETEDGTIVDAEPLLVDDLIYGFRADVGLAPGTTATWHLSGKALGQARSQSQDVPVTFADWPLFSDGTFETWDEAWTQKYGVYRNDPEIDPPIAGERSLSLGRGGSVASIRFVQPPGKATLRFLADSSPFASHPADYLLGLAIDYAAPGASAVSGVPTVTNVCDAHAAYCNCDTNQSNCERMLFDYSLELPAATEAREVLLRFKNYNSDWALESEPILIDDLRFE